MVKDYTESLGLKGSNKAKPQNRNKKNLKRPNISGSVFDKYLNKEEKLLWFGMPSVNSVKSTVFSRIFFAIMWFGVLGKITYQTIDSSSSVFFLFVIAFFFFVGLQGLFKVGVSESDLANNAYAVSNQRLLFLKYKKNGQHIFNALNKESVSYCKTIDYKDSSSFFFSITPNISRNNARNTYKTKYSFLYMANPEQVKRLLNEAGINNI